MGRKKMGRETVNSFKVREMCKQVEGVGQYHLPSPKKPETCEMKSLPKPSRGSCIRKFAKVFRIVSFSFYIYFFAWIFSFK